MKSKIFVVILALLIFMFCLSGGCVNQLEEAQVADTKATQEDNIEQNEVQPDINLNVGGQQDDGNEVLPVLEENDDRPIDPIDQEDNSSQIFHDNVTEIIVDEVILNGVKYTLNDDFYYASAENSAIYGDIIIEGNIKDKPVKVKAFGFKETYITSVTINAGVIEIEELAFTGCTSLKKFIVSEDNQLFTTYDNAIYSKDMKKLIQYPTGAKIRELALPENIEEVAAGSIEIEELTSVRLPKATTLYGRDGVLYNNETMTELIRYPAQKNGTTFTVPSSVTSIAAGAFMNCKKLVTVNINSSQVVTIGANAFRSCVELQNLNFPNTLKTIGNSAFSYCLKLKNVSFQNGLETIGEAAFELCNSSNFKSVYIPGTVTSIGKDVFYGCTALESLSLPRVGGNNQGTEFLGYFFGAKNKDENYSKVPQSLKTITLTGANSLGVGAFKDCTSLTTITLNEGITAIGDEAFSNCVKLTTLTIPNSVATIGREAFAYCKLLNQITLGSGIVSIDYDAFKMCSNLLRANISNLVAYLNIDFANYLSSPASPKVTKMYLNSVLCENVTVPGGITEIKKFAFYNWNDLVSITLPDTLTSIGESAFEACNLLTAITIPNSVTNIAKRAFTRSNLTSVVIPSRIGGISEECFSNCLNLTNVEFNGNLVQIGKKAFYNCSNLPNIVLPQSLQTIGEQAFYSCAKLVALILPGACAQVENSAFSQCYKLERVYIDNATLVSSMKKPFNAGGLLSNSSLKEVFIKTTVLTNIDSQLLPDLYFVNNFTEDAAVLSIDDPNYDYTKFYKE